MGEQASLEFDMTFGDVLFHKLVQAYPPASEAKKISLTRLKYTHIYFCLKHANSLIDPNGFPWWGVPGSDLSKSINF